MQVNSVCIRCGKPRVVVKSWSENTAGSPITYTVTACPDPLCQKIVEGDLKKKQDKLLGIQKKSAERKIAARKRKRGKIKI